MSFKPTNQGLKPIVIAAIFIVIFLFIGIYRSASNIAPEQTQSIGPKPISIGDEATLNWHEDPSDCSKSILVATTKESQEKVSKILLANDELGISEVLLSGEAFAVPNCTKVKVIDTAVAIRQVRIFEGDQIGKSGWVAFEFVKR